jgi:hypothetical protein
VDLRAAHINKLFGKFSGHDLFSPVVNGWFSTKWIVQEAIKPPETILTVSAKWVKEIPDRAPVQPTPA